MPRRTLLLFVLISLTGIARAQISPPGLDDTHAAMWGAVGFSQNFSDRWSITLYGGAARESNPDDFNMLYKQAIGVINQETQYKFNKLFAASFCASLRIQNRYEETAPYNEDTPDRRNEIRLYSRFYYRPKLGKVPLTFSVRPEYRAYRYHHESWVPVDKEVRLRFKGQATFSLNPLKSNQIIVADEILTATDHFSSPDFWTSLEYTENRLSTYFRHVFSQPALIVDIGAMHQFRSGGGYIAHAAFDLIFVDPFGHGKQSE